MTKDTAINGTSFTDEDIERWAAEAESEEGYSGGHTGPSVQGRPVSGAAETPEVRNNRTEN